MPLQPFADDELCRFLRRLVAWGDGFSEKKTKRTSQGKTILIERVGETFTLRSVKVVWLLEKQEHILQNGAYGFGFQVAKITVHDETELVFSAWQAIQGGTEPLGPTPHNFDFIVTKRTYGRWETILDNAYQSIQANL